MKVEYFDVVNERDEVVTQKTRREVHAQGLLHRAVHVLVYNAKGEIFLQKRSMLKDCFPGAWDSSAAGHLDVGESYDACAVRELKEELGVTPTGPLQKLYKIAACEETGQEFVWIYRTVHEGPFILQPEEIESGDWYTPEFIRNWIRTTPEDFASALIILWEYLPTELGGFGTRVPVEKA